MMGGLALYFRWFSVVKKVVGQSHAFNHLTDSGLRRIILHWIRSFKRVIFLASWQRRATSGRNCSSEVFYCCRCHSKHTFHEGCPSEQGDFPRRLWNTGLVSSGASLTSWGDGASLALVGHPSSNGVTIKMPYGVDVLHRLALHPIFSYWFG